jgi:hypothetical protein
MAIVAGLVGALLMVISPGRPAASIARRRIGAVLQYW